MHARWWQELAWSDEYDIDCWCHTHQLTPFIPNYGGFFFLFFFHRFTSWDTYLHPILLMCLHMGAYWLLHANTSANKIHYGLDKDRSENRDKGMVIDMDICQQHCYSLLTIFHTQHFLMRLS